MRVAIYARKSTDDDNKTPDNKSVERQVDHARHYAESKGWVVDPDHIYIDDGISGAEYQNRPSLFKLLNNLKDFDILVMSESSRLGRDMTRNSYYLTTILEAGIEVYYYLTNEQERADTPEARLMLTLKSYASEVEREKASQRSRDALHKKAKQGYNTGGKVFGYDNVPIYATGANGEQVKSHTDYKVNEEEADVIRRIFTMYADGHGHVVMAKTLNGDSRYHKYSLKYFDGKTPSSPRKGTGSWAPSSIYAILRNERYVGLVPWGKYKGVYSGGTQKRKKQAEYLKTEREDLVIIPSELWEQVQKRIKAVRETYIRDNDGNLWGRPDTGRYSGYLLSGLVRCSCGANMAGTYIMSGSSRRWKDYRYQCSYNSNRGSSVCANTLKPRIQEMDSLVLDAIKDSVLNPVHIRYIVEKAIEEIAKLQKSNPQRGEALKEELQKTERELKNLVTAIATGNAPNIILQEIKAREGKIEVLKTELTRYITPAKMSDLDYKKLEKDLTGRLEKFQELLYSDIPVARQSLRKLIKNPLVLTPLNGKGYSLKGETYLGALFPTKMTLASPPGFEPGLPP